MKSPNVKCSFEFFPPKSVEAQELFRREYLRLAELEPRFFSVTYGAGGSAQEGTLQAIKSLQEHCAVPIAPHLSCMGLKRTEISNLLETYKSLGIKRLVALRGDLPIDNQQTGDLRYASELVTFIREQTNDHFHIEVAAYPEYHPQALNVQADMMSLKRKVQAGANSAITQYFYNPDAYFYFLDECAKNNIFVPIVPGIMPITSYPRLAKFSAICGAEIPLWMRKRFESYGDDIESVKKFGIEVVYKLCQTLLKGGAPGLHFYTLNHAEPTYTLMNMLKLAPRKKKITSTG